MRYRLPEILGGGEFEATDAQLWLPDMIRLRVGDSVALFDASVITKVEPPLPPEPPNLTVLRAGTAVYQRDDNAPATSIAAGQWWMAGRMQSTDWASIAHLQFEVLVPAPEPVELPWQGGPLSVAFNPHGLGLDGPHKVVVEVGGSRVHVLASVAHAAGRALWTAADAAENGGAS